MRSGGFTYVGVLVAVAVMGIAAAATGTLWHTVQMRERERELLFVGNEYRRAIEMYYANTPGPQKTYPRELADLLSDPRQPTVRRYLRKLYRDPVTNSTEWGLVRAPAGGIAGIYSLSAARPFKDSGFRPKEAGFSGKSHYYEWKFVSRVSSPTRGSAQPAQQTAPGF